MKSSLLVILGLFSLIYYVNSVGIVCSEDELAREIREDLADNGKLDCIRELDSLNLATESFVVRYNANNSQWDSDCAFEAENEGINYWVSNFKETYGITGDTPFVDVNGTPQADDFPDQADMCEIVRSLIFNGKFPGMGNSLDTIDEETLMELLDCPGDEGQTELCAVTGSSFDHHATWYILLQPEAITAGNEPSFTREDKQ